MHEQVLQFWFDDIPQSAWWKKDSDFDTLIKHRFGDLHKQAVANELFNWRESPQGSLAEIIILDQFSRNIYRDLPESYAFDSQALTLAQTAIEKGFDKQLTAEKCKFLYLPFMHSESRAIHKTAVGLFKALGDENTLDFEMKHKVIIDKYGRYPHRNEVLGRQSSSEEVEFLKQPNSGF